MQDSMEAHEFEYSFKAYVNHAQRQMEKDKNYEPHPMIKSLIIAINEALEKDKPGRYAGLSGIDSNNQDELNHPFFIVLEYSKNRTFTLVEVQDIKINKPVPIKVASIITLLSIKFDRIKGNDIEVDKALKIINDSISFMKMVRFNNDEWKEARDYFKNTLEEGGWKMGGNVNVDEFSEVTLQTPWEQYPQALRSSIATNWEISKRNDSQNDGTMTIVNVFLENYYPKSKILDSVLFMLYGEVSQYFDQVNALQSFSDLYFADDSKVQNTKIRRNDPCPCGSGKKFKKCCNRN